MNNPNQTVYDPFSTDRSGVNLGDFYTPIRRISSRVPSYNNNLAAPDGYNICIITLYYTKDPSSNRIEIPVLFPESFSESLSASYAKESPVGSSVPIVAFSHTNPQQLPLTFIASKDYLPSSYKDFNSYINDIKLMVKPKKSTNSSNKSVVVAPTITLRFLNLFYNVVCDSIDIAYSPIYEKDSFVHATITCQFTVVGDS